MPGIRFLALWQLRVYTRSSRTEPIQSVALSPDLRAVSNNPPRVLQTHCPGFQNQLFQTTLPSGTIAESSSGAPQPRLSRRKRQSSDPSQHTVKQPPRGMTHLASAVSSKPFSQFLYSQSRARQQADPPFVSRGRLSAPLRSPFDFAHGPEPAEGRLGFALHQM